MLLYAFDYGFTQKVQLKFRLNKGYLELHINSLKGVFIINLSKLGCVLRGYHYILLESLDGHCFIHISDFLKPSFDFKRKFHSSEGIELNLNAILSNKFIVGVVDSKLERGVDDFDIDRLRGQIGYFETVSDELVLEEAMA